MSMDILLSKLQSLIDYFHDEYEQGNVRYDSGFNDIVGKIKAELDKYYVELPKDRDGIPLRFGDKVTVAWNDKVYEVAGFSYSQQMAGGEKTIWVDVYDKDKQRNVSLCGASSCRHYTPSTVEDVLREFGDWYAHTKGGCDEEGIIAEYAAKLCLADDGDE